MARPRLPHASLPVLASLLCALLLSAGTPPLRAELRVGAAVVSVNPDRLPTLVNGGMLSRSADTVNTDVNARALVLADDDTEIALVVVDSCMMDRPLLDEAKAKAEKATGIPADRMLISATHTHSAPASMGCLGTDPDPFYQRHLVKQLVTSIVAAQRNLEPARAGWAKVDAGAFTALRRWVRRPDRMNVDPFGNRTVRANMHPGYLSDEATGESGPEDPELGIVAFQAVADNRPIAVMGNFSMHYYGDKAISADYFGLFAEGLKARIAPDPITGRPAFVGLMSHGASGDIYLRDYSQPQPPEKPHDIHSYTEGLLDLAMSAYESIEYTAGLPLDMAERRLRMAYRQPDRQRIEWAQRLVDDYEASEKGMPRNRTEVYAREVLLLHQRKETEIVVQVLRLGELAISTTPNETYAITGLKFKALSPFEDNLMIELANGGDGYIPPPEQHVLGGYNTWPARSAGLEVAAEPRIVEALLEMSEALAGRPRRVPQRSRGPAAEALARSKPLAWWRGEAFAGPVARDELGNHDGIYEDEIGLAYYLEGDDALSWTANGEINRSPHFAGGRLRANLPGLGDRYSIALSLWNGMPDQSREVLGWAFSRGRDHGLGPHGDHLGVEASGRLVYQQGGDGGPSEARVVGSTDLPRWTWARVVLVRDGEQVRLYLNGQREFEAELPPNERPPDFGQLFFGGRSDRQANWEGKLDEIAVWDRALDEDEARALSNRQR